MSKNRGGLRRQSPVKWLIGLLPVFAVTLAMVLALNGVDIARATEPEDAVQETESVAAVPSVDTDATDNSVDDNVAADAVAPKRADDDTADGANVSDDADTSDKIAAEAKAAEIGTEDEDLVGDGDYPTNATATAIVIQDDVKANGQFILKATIDGKEYTGAEAAARLAAAGYTVKWSSSNGADCSNGLKKVTTTGTVQAVEQNGGWINVAYTNGAKATYTVTVSKAGQTNLTAQKTVTYAGELENGSFENNTAAYFNDQNPSSTVPSWNSTSPHIEIGQGRANGMQWYVSSSDPDQGAADGTYFAELNADQYSTLYQDVLTMPGQTMYWSFAHRARTAGDNRINQNYSKGDTMALIIAPVELVEDITTQKQLQDFYASLTNKNGDNKVTSGDKTYTVYVYQDTAGITYQSGYYDRWGFWHDSPYLKSEWKNCSGEMTVPEGQFTSRYFFMAVDTASGNSTVGNFLDHVSYSQEQPSVAQDKARLTVEKTVVGLTQEQVAELVKKSFITTTAGDNAVTLTLSNVTKNTNGSYKLTYTSDDVDVTSGQSVTFTTTENAAAAAVEGYSMTSTYENAIETKVQAGSTGKVEITNTYMPATCSFTLTKVDSENPSTKLSGAKFTVSQTMGEGDDAVTKYVQADGTMGTEAYEFETAADSDVKGTFSIASLATGDYTITEIAAPTGYDMPSTTTHTLHVAYQKGEDGKYTLVATLDGKSDNITVANGSVVVTVANARKNVTLTIQKNLTGAQADTTKIWTVSVTSPNGTKQTKTIKDTTADGNADTTEGSFATFNFKYGDTVTVTEDKANQDGYTTTYKVGNGDSQDYSNGAQVVLNGDTTIVFTNTKTDTVITGIKSASVPGVLTAVAVAAFTIVGGMALLQRNALESATTGAHTARGWHRRTNHKSATRRGTNLKGASRQGSHMRGGDDA